MDKILDSVKKDDLGRLIELTGELTDLGSMIFPHGRNLMHFAAKTNNVRMLDYLFDKKVYVNHRDQFNQTPFYTAAANNCVDSCLWFIEKEVDPTVVSSITNKTAFDVAKSDCKKEIANYCVLFDQMLGWPNFKLKYLIADFYIVQMISIMYNSDFKGCDEMTTIVRNDGVPGLIEVCMKKDAGYTSFFVTRFQNCDTCLICDKMTDEWCEKCNSVKICATCLKEQPFLTNLHRC